jgi:hypothetical protein
MNHASIFAVAGLLLFIWCHTTTREDRRPVLSPTARRKIDYLHYNPVKAGLCKYPEDYHFSSACFYEFEMIILVC